MGVVVVAGGIAVLSFCSGFPFALARISRRLKEARLIGIKDGSDAVIAGLKPFYGKNSTSDAALLAACASFE